MSSVPSATRGPGTTVRGSLMIETRPLRTAGTDERTRHTSSSRLRCSVSHVAGSQLEDDFWCTRKDELARRLDGLLLDVREDVLASGGDQHVVEKAHATARVDAAQRQRVAPEDQQGSRLRSADDAGPDASQRGVNPCDESVRLSVAADPPAELSNRRRHIGKAGVFVDEHGNRRALELPPQIGLALVDDNQVGSERENSLEIGIEQRADSR